jgi:glutathione synthase/RimK-type ligase-like ATP-grasp enzyme
MLAWDGGAESAPDELVVLRSTWNYYADIDGFLAWVERTAARSRMCNPSAIVRGNAKKTYLGELAEAGFRVTPTAYVGRGASARVDVIARERGWDDPRPAALVIKPVVSAGSFLTERFEASARAEAQRFLDEITKGRDVMIQPWMASVETYGERALVWIDGELTHAVRKSPRFASGAESVSEAVPITPEERAFADEILARRAKGLLYARVDVVRDADGATRLMELELIEPSLFLKQLPAALDRLVAGIVARASDRQ